MREETPVSATWQRWTIDEIDLGIVRLAVAEAHVPLESSVAEAEATQARPSEIRERVFEVEDAEPDVLWGDERVAFMTVDELEPFLKRRAQIRGLPGNRPLREGDVFWVVRPQPQAAEAEPRTTVQALARTEMEDVQVWDVTAAARQVAKRTYDRAVRAAADESAEPAGQA